ncbi:winged helix-turn-helix transcriptional regulator [Peribacillus frigoritolerans]
MNRAIPGITKQVLTIQLHEKEKHGLISRKKYNIK